MRTKPFRNFWPVKRHGTINPAIAREEAPGSIRRNMPDPIPAIIIGRLAVDHRYQGTGIGQGLLRDALVRSINVSEQIGARTLIVYALNEQAETFYLRHGFLNSPTGSGTLLLPLKI